VRSLQIQLEGEGTRCTVLIEVRQYPADREHHARTCFLDLNLTGYVGDRGTPSTARTGLCTLVIMISGVQDARATIEAIRLGAFDYIRKPLDLDAVLVTIEKAAQHLKSPTNEIDPCTRS